MKYEFCEETTTKKIWRWGTIYFISSCICNASFFAIRFSIISTYRNGIVRTCLLAVCFHFSPFLFHIFNEVIAVQMTCDKWNVCTLSPFSLFLSLIWWVVPLLAHFIEKYIRLHSTDCVHHQLQTKFSRFIEIYAMHGKVKLLLNKMLSSRWCAFH